MEPLSSTVPGTPRAISSAATPSPAAPAPTTHTPT